MQQRDVGEAGLPVGTHSVDDRVQVRAAGNALGDILGPDKLCRTRKTGRCRQVGVDLPASAEPTELVVGAFDGGIAIRVPADGYLPDDPASTGDAGALQRRVPGADEVCIGLDRDQVIGEGGEFLDGPVSAHRDREADRDIRQVPQPRGIHLVVVAPPVDQTATEQRADDLDGLPQHVLPLCDGRPTLADDMLVQVLAATQPQGESAVGEDLHGCCLLRDDRGVIAHGWAGHIGVEAYPFGGLRYCSQHRPGVGRMTLRCQPRRKVVRAYLEVEASVLSRNRILDKVFRPILFRHQGIAKPCHSTLGTPA